MHKLLIFLIIINTIIFTVNAENSPGTSSGNFLLEDIGARPTSLGGAFGAVEADVNAMRYNPAGLTGITQYEYQFTYTSSWEDIDYGSIMIGIPLKNKESVLGFSIDYADYGDFLKRDNQGYDQGTFSANESLLTLSYSQPLKKNFKLGLNLKYFRSKIEKEKAESVMLDVGSIYNYEQITLGLSVQNFGQKLEYIKKKEDLPLNVKLSVKYSPLLFSNPPKFFADLNMPNGDDISLNMGLELWLNEAIAIRCGYRDKVEEGNFVGGLGIRSNSFQFDYAYMWAEDLDVAHRVSASFRFGGVPNNQSYEYKRNKFLKNRTPDNYRMDNDIRSEKRKNRTIKLEGSQEKVIDFIDPISTIK